MKCIEGLKADERDAEGALEGGSSSRFEIGPGRSINFGPLSTVPAFVTGPALSMNIYERNLQSGASIRARL